MLKKLKQYFFFILAPYIQDMAFNIPLLKNLDFVTDDKGELQWIELDQFVSFLKRHHLTTDIIKKLRRVILKKNSSYTEMASNL